MSGPDRERFDSESARAPTATYRPLERRAKWVTGLLLAGIAADLAGVVSGLMQRSLLADAGSGNLITSAEANSNDVRQLVVGLIQGAIFVLTSAAFLFWFHRAYRNLPAVGARGLRFRPGWAVGSWFVPFLNLWRPKQIANDIWRASGPEALVDRSDWRDDSVPKLYVAWWLGFLISQWLYSTASRLILRAEDVDELQAANSVFLAADSFSIVTAALAILVVHRTTARQSARAARFGVIAQEDRRPLWRRRSAWAALVAVLAAFGFQGLIAFASWNDTLGSSQQEALPRPPSTAPRDALLADDFSEEGVWSVQDDDAATTTYVDGSYSLLVKEAQATWYIPQPLPKAVDSMSLEADTMFDLGRPRADYYGLVCVASAQKYYFFGISPDGYHTIAFDPGGDRPLERLVEDRADRRFSPDHATNRLRAECIRRRDRSVLKLAVNGQLVAETTHRGSIGKFVGVGFFAYSQNGGTSVRFDDLVVRELNSR